MIIRTATPSDTDEIRALWNVCFPDDSGFNPYFFDHIFDAAQTVLLLEENHISAMTQMLPYQMGCGAQTANATYIYGACTAPHARRRGLMSRLLEWTFALDREAGKAASILIPQEAWLFNFYKAYGYEPFFFLAQECFCTAEVNPAQNTRICRLSAQNISEMDNLYQMCTGAHSDSWVLRSHEQWHVQTELFDHLGLGVFGLRDTSGSLLAYAFVWREQSGLWAQELMAIDDMAKQSLAAHLLAMHGSEKIKITTAGGAQALGCAKFYDSPPQGAGYMNLMFN